MQCRAAVHAVPRRKAVLGALRRLSLACSSCSYSRGAQAQQAPPPTHHVSPLQDLIDVGWTSVWVKVVTQWCVSVLYAWTMAAPLLFPDRDF